MSLRILGIGHGLYALAALGLAILILGYRDFAPMWQSVPPSIPWREMWVDGTGLLVLGAGVGLCFPRAALPGAVTIGAYLGVWTAMRSAPVIVDPFSVGTWYGLCEALTPVLGAWILYGSLRTPWHASERGLRVARVLFGLNCAVYGLAHFAYADLTASMVPAWLPGRLDLAYLTGLGHLAAGLGLVAGILPRLAATLEAIMMSLFGALVWVPTLLAQRPPTWAATRRDQWSEFEVTLLLAASAWIVAGALRSRPRKERLGRND